MEFLWWDFFKVFHTCFGNGHQRGFNLFHSCTFLLWVFFFFFPFRVWLEVNRKWSYILLDSNLTKCICGLKLAFLKRGVVGIGYIWGLLCHLGYKVLWLYSQNETSVLIAKLYSPCLNTLWGVLFKILFFLF